MEATDRVLPFPARPRRWRWVLSLRGLMLLVLVVGGLLGGWVRVTTVRREAIATIRAAGGGVNFQDEKPEARGFWVEVYRRTGWDLAREVAVVEVDDPPPSVATSGPRPSRDEMFAAAARLSRVEIFGVNRGRVTSANIADLVGTQVEELFLGGVDDVSAELLTQIGRLRPSTRLQINRPKSGANAATIRAIAAMPQLESLDLHGFDSLHSEDLVPLGQLTKLKRLAMLPAPVDDSFLDQWQALKQFNTLELPLTRITDERLRALVSRSPGLEGIYFDGSLLTDAGVSALGQCSHLGSVDFLGHPTDSPGLTDASLRTMGRLPWLTTLSLKSGRFTEAGLDALANLPLQRLFLGSIESISATGMKRLMGSRIFGRLGLAGPAITDDLLPLLVGHLNPGGYLDLSGSAITDAGMYHLLALRVAELNLSDTALTDAGLATLATGTTVRMLMTWHTKITPAGAAAFRKARPGTRLTVDLDTEEN